MDGQIIATVGQALGQFLGGFRSCFGNIRAFDNFIVYCQGLAARISKNVETIAHEAGKGVRALQCFLTQGDWDHQRVRDQLQRRVARKHCPAPGQERDGSELVIGLIDEHGEPKSGNKTPGVKRQYLGCLGKTDNGIVTVHLGIQRGSFSTLLDSQLFLPRDWAEDRPRCREAGIPDEMGHRSKPTIALELLDRALGNGVRFDFLTFDELYGRSMPFLRGLEQRGQYYVAEVPCNFRCHGRRPQYRSLQRAFTPCEVRNLRTHGADFRSQPWRSVRIRRQTREPQQWQVRSGRVYLELEDGGPSKHPYRLIVAHQPETGEYKYFISNAPQQTSEQTLLKAAFSRAEVEHQFRTAKQKLGLGDYEGRSYVGLIRHHILCILMMLFAAEQRAAQADFFP